MKELRSTEGVNTEKNQTGNSSNITLGNIYNAIRYLGQEEQVKILENYKLTELYLILADKDKFEKYISYLRNVSRDYFGRVLILRALYVKALEESRTEKLTMREVISQSYDGLSEEERQKFCQDMLGRKEFFGATCRMIMDVFVNASEAEKKDASE